MVLAVEPMVTLGRVPSAVRAPFFQISPREAQREWSRSALARADALSAAAEALSAAKDDVVAVRDANAD